MMATFLPSKTFAQKIRFTDSTNHWRYLWYYSSHPPHVPSSEQYKSRKYYYSGADTANGQTYRKLFRDQNYAGMVREDTVSNNVFMIRPNTSTEKVLYDFTVAPGDKITESIHGAVFVVQVDSVWMNNQWLKRVSTSDTFNLYTWTYVEGLGSITDYPIPTWGLDPNYGRTSLICFSNNMVFLDSITNTPCKDSVLEIREVSAEEQAVIYPQPSNGKVTIHLPIGFSDGTLTVVNITGQRMKQITFRQRGDIIVEKLPAGLYLYVIRDSKTGAEQRGKIQFID
jgi:hypothetical protein